MSQKILAAAAAVSMMLPFSLQAGGIERMDQSVSLIFESGTHARLAFGFVDPNVSGTDALGQDTGDVGEIYWNRGGGFKWDHNDKLSFALIYDKPFGAPIRYRDGAYSGVSAEVYSNALTLIARYKINENFSVYGGPRVQTLDASLFNPGLFGAPSYSLDIENSFGFGASVGVAYEIPEIAFRASLTYNSEVKHEYDNVLETVGGTVNKTDFSTTTPQSVNFELQSGISPTMLAFFKARWVDWSEFEVAPAVFTAGNGAPLLEYEDDDIQMQLGLVKVFSPKWAGVAMVGFEGGHDRDVTLLRPVDGYSMVGLGAVYTPNEKVQIAAGARYLDLYRADGPLGDFDDNHVIGGGVELNVKF